jgi:hypothetical protein
VYPNRSTDPTTAAGKWLRDRHNRCDPMRDTADDIAAIEREAREQEHDRLAHVTWAEPAVTTERAVTAALARVRERVDGLAEGVVKDPVTGRTFATNFPTVDRAAVLAIIDEEAGR